MRLISEYYFAINEPRFVLFSTQLHTCAHIYTQTHTHKLISYLLLTGILTGHLAFLFIKYSNTELSKITSTLGFQGIGFVY